MIFNRSSLFVIVCYITGLEAFSLKVKTDNGWVKGTELGSMYTWRGIPFAKPPLGNLRFEHPQAPDNWKGVWDATYDRSECTSVDTNQLFSSVIDPRGNEDCLYINVYAPNSIKKNSSLPVMVWIYGGGFIQGNSTYSTYGPDTLVHEGVIVVSFNYRVGIFGFLSTGDNAAPGNNGLRDQIFALKWVQKNIKAFGGDPKQVTVFGQSAGSVSISYLLLSSLTKGLFSAAIMESGTALSSWGLSRTSKEAAFATGVALGIITTDSQTLVNRLKTVPEKDLQRIATITMGAIVARVPANGLVYAPVIEQSGPNAVITDSSYEKLRLGDFQRVPQIIGYNNAEALIFKQVADLLPLYVGSYDFTPSRLVPNSMKANQFLLPIIGIKIKNYYAGPLGSLAFPNSNFLKYATDTGFVRPIQKTVKLTAQHVKTYAYKFSYTHDPKQDGAAHMDELNYIFNSDKNNESDKIIRNCLTKLWTNFAKYRNPTSPCQKICGGIKWLPTTSNNFDYINIDINTVAGQNPDEKSIKFWADLFLKYANPPFDTY